MLVLFKGSGKLNEKNNNWQYKAAANIKMTCSETLECEPIEQIAARLLQLFGSANDYNESIRTNMEIPPESSPARNKAKIIGIKKATS